MNSRILHAPLAILTVLVLAQCSSSPPKYTGGQTNYYPGGQTGLNVPPNGLYQPVAYNPNQPAPFPAPGQYMPPQQQQAYVPPYTVQRFSSPSDVAPQAPWINAGSYVMIDPNSGRVLAARNADTIRGAASTQKILTALIIAEAGNLDKRIRVEASDVAVEPSKLGIRPGETYTRRELLIAFLVKSSNDVSNTLARDNAGSTYAFANKMTARARALGATSSVFKNAHGLTAPGQYSTARDIARIAAVAYQNPAIRDAVSRQYYTFRFNSGRVVTLKNTNDLLKRMPECNGMKTGFTNAAGRCLISCAKRGGRQVILVQLGTKTQYIWDDGEKLMRWGLVQ